jgi:hypothetical protein
MRTWNKVFGIGLSKTGTLSLDAAFGMLGLRSVHYPPAEDMLEGRFSVLAGYDAASDISVSVAFRELDRAFPGSRFILTIRDPAHWLESIEAHLARRNTHAYTGRTPAGMLRERVYGSRTFNRDRYTRAFRCHTEAVDEHFRSRPDDLLVMDICSGQGWDHLCPFLGLPTPTEPFPHRHKTPRPPAEPPVVRLPSLPTSIHPSA